MKPLRVVVGVAFAAVALVLAAAFGRFVYGAQPITFNVSAQTEHVRFVTGREPAPRWALEDVELVRDYGAERVPFSGYFQPAPSVEVVIERVAGGPLYVHVSPAGTADGSGAASVGTFVSPDERVLGPAGRTVELFVTRIAARADSGSTIVIPVSGAVEAGRAPGTGTWGGTALLRSGRVRMLGRSIFGSRVFEAGGVELDPGDQFRVEVPRPPSLGFVLVDERPGLSIAYRAIGRRGVVVRPGGGTYPISASFFDRVLRDPLFLAISLFSGAFVVMATILGFVRDWSGPARRREAAPDGPASRVADPAPVEPEPDLPAPGAGSAAGAALLLVLLLAPAAAAAQSSVLVRAGQEGQGVLRTRANTCYVVVPGHVVERVVGDVEVIGWNGYRAAAVPEQTFERDLAVLRVREGGDLICTGWLPAFPAELLRSADGHLRTIEDTGAETRLPVIIRRIGPDFITVRPRDPGEGVTGTMSGAPLVVSGLIVGMLQAVCGAGAEDCVGEPGDGVVLRLDAIMRLTDGFFGDYRLPGEEIPFAEYGRLIEAAQAAREDSIRAADQARLDSSVAEVNARLDSIHMTARGGRPPDLPTFQRDVEHVLLLVSPGVLDCVLNCLPDLLPRPWQRAEGRVLYAVIQLSEPILTSAPGLPDEVARCSLHSTRGRLRTFRVPRTAEASGGGALAWGETPETLPPGEYWLECVIDGREFESTHLTRLRPTRPFGQLAIGEDGTAFVRTVRVTTPDGAEASWRVNPAEPRPRVVLPVPRRPDVAITIRFDVEQAGGALPEEMPDLYCQVNGLVRDGDARIENLRPGAWRVSQEITTGGQRWHAGEYSGACGSVDEHYFEFRLVLQ